MFRVAGLLLVAILCIPSVSSANNNLACLIDFYHRLSNIQDKFWDNAESIVRSNDPKTMEIFDPVLASMRLESKLTRFSFDYYTKSNPEKLTLTRSGLNWAPIWKKCTAEPAAKCQSPIYDELAQIEEFELLYNAWEKSDADAKKARLNPQFRNAARAFFKQAMADDLYKKNKEMFSKMASEVKCQ